MSDDDIPDRPVDPVDEGGEAPCLLPDLCEECGLVIEDRLAERCPRCGTPRQ